ncbi:MAG: hypothetical protein ACM3Y9_09260 [Ignavibacteria bacterium]
MVTTATIGSYTTSQSQGSQTANVQASAGARAATTSASTSSAPGTSSATISALARQLAASAARVDAYGRNHTRSQLAARANDILKDLTAQASPTLQAKRDGEKPRTDDPDLVARAGKATTFMAATRAGSASASNPFAGLSREQLYDVVFDDSGAYTFNERAAAFTELSRQEGQWRDKVSADAAAEYKATGKLTKFFSSVLDHFNSLPAIQQSLYPADYANTLKAKIAQNASYGSTGLNAIKDMLGNPTAAASSVRQSSATAQLAGLKLLQQARNPGSSSASLPAGGAATDATQNTRNVDALLKSTYASSTRSTLFNYFEA